MSRTAVIPEYLLPTQATLDKYGLTLADWKALWWQVGGRCPICVKPFKRNRLPCVDHRHHDGLIRGLVCSQCNIFLGEMHDDAGLLGRAASYLNLPPAVEALGPFYVPNSSGRARYEDHSSERHVLPGEHLLLRGHGHQHGARPVKAPRLYLSGGMTNIRNFNFDLFDDVAVDLRAQGILIDSPAEHDRAEIRRLLGPDKRAEDMDGYAEGDVVRYMASIGTATEIMFVWDFAMIAEGDGIALLPGWEKSTGARHERYVAEALGKSIYLVVREQSQAGAGGDFWTLELDEVQDRLTSCLKAAWANGTVKVID